MTDEKQVFSTEISGSTFTVEIGELAKQAGGAAMIHYGDTSVLAVATGSKEPKDLPFFPLTVNYEERLYAVGKIPGGFIKREGRPSEKAILASRLIDRPIRPLFPDGYRNEVQVISTVMSVDQDCSSEIAAMIGSSIALSISNIPFQEPIAGVQVGRVDGEFIINPTIEQQEKSDIELTVAGTKNAVNMVEAGADEVPEEVMLEAIMFGHEEIKRLVEFQEEIISQANIEKSEVNLFELDRELTEKIEHEAKDKLTAAIQVKEKHEREDAIAAVKEEVIAAYDEETEADTIKQVKNILENMVKEEVRRLITKEKIRPDGRKPDEVRPLSSRTHILPRTHGSGLFTRGQTQALSICTLGALGDVQILDGLDLEESKRFMHHYNFPQYSVGETGPIRAPGRREIGHGALGERALEKVIPSENDFPYTIRLVSEVLESNGSSSQASICASTLALMDAGVPIKAPVAGIAMGLVKSGEDYTILTDIQGMEDALGDMDFKVAGTENGITALQMDIKIDGLSREILEEAMEQAKVGRMQILESMLATIAEPKTELSPFAPKIMTMAINPDKIRDVIGPSGKQINQIIDETGVKIDIEQDGSVYISSTDKQMNEKAKKIIEDIVREVEVGQMYLGTVKRIEKFGAFVELFKGKDGLVHISELQIERTNKVEDVVSVGDEILVKVKEIDRQGRINLSRKAVLLEEKEREEKANK
ncbi:MULTISPECIES: polyribonucleotide nucleotidyltransferase [unclassified Oceanobacillus]|uniref:polyribonucleotide nucleotidyltransferase n=1 Tax=unclassified Oceanobacillus TaxID=2630292 RepID=UPI0012EBA0BD|nr:polyribonucleotide nucleotidyltransferase [Oceanobacillus sp. AG]